MREPLATIAECHALEQRVLLSHAALRTASAAPAPAGVVVPAKKDKPPPAAGPVAAASPVGADGTLTINGTSGDDVIILSTNGSVTTYSINGNATDVANGTFTAIVVNGGDGDDSITVGAGVIGCALNGGRGNDTIAGGTGADAIDGGAGTDTVDYSLRTTDLEILLDGAVGASGLTTSGANGGAEGDTIVNCEHAIGGSGNDEIKGGGSADYTLDGGAGDDTLIGSTGDDTLNGGRGNDTLDGKTGSDFLGGGAGFDSADYRFRTEDLVLKIDGQNDSGANGGREHDTIDTDVERIVGGSGDDLIVGSDADNSLAGNDGNDTIVGNGGNDSIDGNAGDDSLVGNDGNDVLTGGAGNDTMQGGNGDDTFIANDGQADAIDGGAGNDTATADAGLDSIVNVESGVGLSLPDITVTVNGSAVTDNFSTIDFGTVGAGGTGPTQTFTIVNGGSAALNLGAVSVPAGFTLIDTPASAVAPGGVTTFTVQLDASTPGNYSGQISFTTNVGNKNPFNFAVTGSVVVPQVPQLTVLSGRSPVVNGGSISFGTVTAGGTAPSQTFTVRNDGNATLSLGSLVVPSGFTVTDGLAGSLGPGASDTFTVQLDPSVVGAHAGTISFTTNDPNAPTFSLSVSGTVGAAPAPVIAVAQGSTDITDNSASVVDFGNVVAGNAGPTRTFTITNNGNARLRLGTVSAPAGFTVVTQPAATVNPGGSTTFTVQLNGSAAAGTYAGQLTLATNDPTANPFVINVSGTVVAAAQPHLSALSVGRRNRLTALPSGSGQAVNFGAVLVGAKAPAVQFVIRNDGTATLNVSNVTLPTGFTVAARLSSTRLKPGATATFTLAMVTSSAASLGGQVTIFSNDLGQPAYTFTVAGSVNVPTPLVVVSIPRSHHRVTAMRSGGSVSFGSAVQGARAPAVTFTVSNLGTARLRTYGVTLPAGFVLAKGLARYIQPGASDTLVVQMSTDNAGSLGGTLAIGTSDTAHSPYDLSISGSVVTPVGGGGGGGGDAVSATLSGGTLTIDGTGGADVITVGGKTRAVTVVANGHQIGGTFAGVNKIVVNAGAGDDRVAVNVPINGTLNGDDGNDTLTGGGGNDVLNGGAGDDVLDGGDGNDVLNGDDGNDTLTGGGGVDVMKGGAGDDSIDAADGISDSLVDGGPGNDSIQKDRTDPWTKT